MTVEAGPTIQGGSGCLTEDPASRLWIIGGRGMPWLGRIASGGSLDAGAATDDARRRGRGGGTSGHQQCGVAAQYAGPLPLWERPAPLIIRVSVMASSLRATEIVRDEPRHAARARVPLIMEGWRQGGIEYVTWARHSSGPELKAALQVGLVAVVLTGRVSGRGSCKAWPGLTLRTQTRCSNHPWPYSSNRLC